MVIFMDIGGGKCTVAVGAEKGERWWKESGCTLTRSSGVLNVPKVARDQAISSKMLTQMVEDTDRIKC